MSSAKYGRHLDELPGAAGSAGPGRPLRSSVLSSRSLQLTAYSESELVAWSCTDIEIIAIVRSRIAQRRRTGPTAASHLCMHISFIIPAHLSGRAWALHLARRRTRAEHFRHQPRRRRRCD